MDYFLQILVLLLTTIVFIWFVIFFVFPFSLSMIPEFDLEYHLERQAYLEEPEVPEIEDYMQDVLEEVEFPRRIEDYTQDVLEKVELPSRVNAVRLVVVLGVVWVFSKTVLLRVVDRKIINIYNDDSNSLCWEGNGPRGLERYKLSWKERIEGFRGVVHEWSKPKEMVSEKGDEPNSNRIVDNRDDLDIVLGKWL